MLRSAEEIWKEELVLWETTSGGSLDDHMRHAINKARKEAIEACAEVVNLKIEFGYGTLESKGTGDFNFKEKVERAIAGHGDSGYEIIEPNKQSILNLLNTIK